jgi:cation transport ATPase
MRWSRYFIILLLIAFAAFILVFFIDTITAFNVLSILIVACPLHMALTAHYG